MHLYRERNGTWYADIWYGNHRKRKSLRTKSKSVANKRLQELAEEADWKDNRQTAKIPPGEFLEDYRRYCDRTRTPKTARANGCRIGILSTWLSDKGIQRISDIDRVVVKDLQNYLWARGLNNSTVNRYVSLLKSSLTWAVETGLLLQSPIIGVRKLPEARGEKRRVFTRAEMDALYLACQDVQYGAFIELLSLTGARMDELRLLEWRNVSLDRREITFERTKSHLARTVPLNDRGMVIVNALNRNPKRYVFGASAPAWNPNVCGQRFTRMARRLGIAGSLHDFRSTFASRLLDKGVSPKTVQYLLGDKTARMVLEVYAQVVPDSARRAVESL
ncbi:tyrosine-type recombinase/integrase [Candidatus Pacearchaeota archaeon]|jgi:integrase|nr:tyrosine-type recombinase/integrase [Candidatus Pacearchaeota archaeon]